MEIIQVKTQFILCLILTFQSLIIEQQGGKYELFGKIGFFFWIMVSLLVFGLICGEMAGG